MKPGETLAGDGQSVRRLWAEARLLSGLKTTHSVGPASAEVAAEELRRSEATEE